MTTKQLKLAIVQGDISSMLEAIKLTISPAPTVEDYEEMIVGSWAWSTDGSNIFTSRNSFSFGW